MKTVGKSHRWPRLACANVAAQVRVADSGSSALAMVAELRPSLILLDASAPGDRVPTLESRVTAVVPHARCIVIADDPERPRAAKPGGADVILMKGFTTP